MMADTPRQPEVLSPADLARLGDLMFVARKLVEGLYAGRHRSPRRGHSTEFYDHRPYAPGDEPRRVDWKAWARTDRLYVRRYRHEGELTVHLLVDHSASMDFSGVGRAGAALPTKWRVAQQVAAALAYLAVVQSDRVSLTQFANRAESLVGVGGGAEHLKRLLEALQSTRCRGAGDPRRALGEAAGLVGATHGGRGLVIIISDLLEPAGDWMEGLGAMLGARCDIACLQVLSPDELDLRHVGHARLVDAESGESVRTFGPSARAAYTEQMAHHIEQLRQALAGHRIDHQLLVTDAPPIEGLRSFVARRAAAVGAR